MRRPPNSDSANRFPGLWIGVTIQSSSMPMNQHRPICYSSLFTVLEALSTVLALLAHSRRHPPARPLPACLAACPDAPPHTLPARTNHPRLGCGGHACRTAARPANAPWSATAVPPLIPTDGEGADSSSREKRAQLPGVGSARRLARPVAGSARAGRCGHRGGQRARPVRGLARGMAAGAINPEVGKKKIRGLHGRRHGRGYIWRDRARGHPGEARF